MKKPLQYSQHFKRRRNDERGQSFVEFALIVPILFLMLIGVVFIAQGFTLQTVLNGAAYEGARIWAKNPIVGSVDACTPPACDPSVADAKNFDKYIIPVVRQYITSNGFDGQRASFASRSQLELASRNPQSVKVVVRYPLELPVGSFASDYQQIIVTASCTMKRGG